MSIYDMKEEIIKIIDRGEWKHSHHLPKNDKGYIDWFNTKSQQEIILLLECAQMEGLMLMNDAKTILEKINNKITHRTSR